MKSTPAISAALLAATILGAAACDGAADQRAQDAALGDAYDALTDGADTSTTDAAAPDGWGAGDAPDVADTSDTADALASGVWRPAPETSWHWQLQGDLDLTHDVDMYDIDLFDTAPSTIDQLHGRGVKVICYFSAGSYEDWRADANEFADADYGQAMGNWPGEWWLDVRSANVRQVMKARLDLAASKGCDGVEPDNVDGYQNDTGFALTRADQLDYNRFLARQAHERGLSVGLKNAVGLVDLLEDDFDWALDESCLDYDECSALRPFIDADKAVFHAEYVDAAADGPAKQSTVCADPSRSGFSTKIFTWDLDGWSLPCP